MTVPVAADQAPAASASRLPVLLASGAALIVVVLVVSRLLAGGGGGEEAATPTTVAAPTPAAVPTTPPPPPGGPEPAETFEVFTTKNPFVPLRVAAPPGGAASPAGAPGTTAAPTSAPALTDGGGGQRGATKEAGARAGATEPQRGERVAVLDVFTEQGRTVANVKVNDTVHKVRVGEVFSGRFKVVSLSQVDGCGRFRLGDDRFRLCKGEQARK